MSVDYYIKTNTRAEWVQQSIAAGIIVENPLTSQYEPVEGFDIDEIGTLMGVEGYHVNIRAHRPLSNTTSLSLINAPRTPSRVWL